MAERPELWMVCLDGCAIARALRRDQADAYAQSRAVGMESHRAGTRIRAREYTVVKDTEAMAKRAALYTEFRGLPGTAASVQRRFGRITKEKHYGSASSLAKPSEA